MPNHPSKYSFCTLENNTCYYDADKWIRDPLYFKNTQRRVVYQRCPDLPILPQMCNDLSPRDVSTKREEMDTEEAQEILVFV
jgi:hypothetical protein